MTQKQLVQKVWMSLDDVDVIEPHDWLIAPLWEF